MKNLAEKTQLTFIYQPTTIDKVVCDYLTPLIHTWVWPNGCRHVVGGTRLSYYTAQPKAWWRTAATAMAEKITWAIGGIAWDDCGLVSLVVPTHFAWEVDQWMREARAVSGGGGDEAAEEAARRDDRRNQASMILTGAAMLQKGGVVGRSFPDPAFPPPDQPRYKDWTPTGRPPEEYLRLSEIWHNSGQEVRDQIIDGWEEVARLEIERQLWWAAQIVAQIEEAA